MLDDPGYDNEGSNPTRYTCGVFSTPDNYGITVMPSTRSGVKLEIKVMLSTNLGVKLRATYNDIPHAAFGRVSFICRVNGASIECVAANLRSDICIYWTLRCGEVSM